MADQYMSLAQALYTYGDKKATKIPSQDDAKCNKQDLETIQDLVDRGYKYLGVEAGGFSATEIEDSASSPTLIKIGSAEWEKLRDEIPYQSALDDACNDPEQTDEEKYGWAFKDTYFYSETFNFFGGTFGKNVFFEGMNINLQSTTKNRLEVQLDDDLKSYNFGNDTTIIVGQDGDPIIEFNGHDITCYVDVHIEGTSDCAKLDGKGIATPGIYVNQNFNNNFTIGGQC